MKRTLVFAAVAAVAAEAFAGTMRKLPVIDLVPRSDWVNVKDFGATGDGVTDDTAALQAAFGKVGPGVTIYLPPGKYVITDMLKLRREFRVYGGGMVGHGEATEFVWKGAAYGRMLRVSGLTESVISGFVLNGNGKAAVGLWLDNEAKFCTETRYSYIACRNLNACGILSENDAYDKFSDSEPFFDNCIFDNVRTGVSFTSFNDYDFAFKRCLFIGNRVCGIECSRGNFYVQDCRFEHNGVDVIANVPEHGSSIRRSVSVGSRTFFQGKVGVAGITIENCTVKDWTSPDGAISWNGLMIAANNTFLSEKKLPVFAQEREFLALSGNSYPEGSKLFSHPAPIPKQKSVEIPAGRLPALKLPADMNFLATEVRQPKTVFDAKRDFGAKGDGKADDTEAVRRTIEAAARAGREAIAYFPTGTYNFNRTIPIENAACVIGGNGQHSILLWTGDHSAPALHVKDPQDLRMEYFRIVNKETLVNHGAEWDGLTGPNILQEGGSRPTRITYDGVVVYGRYQNAGTAERQGALFRNLKAHDIVYLHDLQGNLRLENASDGVVIGSVCHEGSITVDGPTGKGFLGIMARLATWSASPLQVRRNGSFVLPDFYMEQGYDKLLSLSGSPDLPPGRVTVGLKKLERSFTKEEEKRGDKISHLAKIDGYRGTLNVLGVLFYPCVSETTTAAFDATGDGCAVNFLCPSYYNIALAMPGNVRFQQFVVFGGPGLKTAGSADDSVFADSFDDCTRLGRYDLWLNFGFPKP